MGFVHNFYCQQTPHGSFVMGSGHDTEPKDLSITSGWEFMEYQAKKCMELLPKLKDLNIVRQWAGLYNLTRDKHPIYDKVPGIEGMYLAAGFSGRGFMLGPVTGVTIAEMILGLKQTVDVSRLSYGRFEKGDLVVEPSVV